MATVLAVSALVINAVWVPLLAVVGYRVRRRDAATDKAAAAERAALAATLQEHSDALTAHTQALTMLVTTVTPPGGTPLPERVDNLGHEIARLSGLLQGITTRPA